MKPGDPCPLGAGEIDVPDIDAVGQTELGVAESIGELVQFWGFKRPMGRLWAMLYLSPRPLGAAELGSRLKMSAGSVSMTLNELLKWGAIRRTWRPGERRDYFECEPSLWKLIRRVLRERELLLIRETKEAFDRAHVELGAPPASSSDELAFKRGRVAELQRLASTAEAWIADWVASEPATAPEMGDGPPDADSRPGERG